MDSAASKPKRAQDGKLIYHETFDDAKTLRSVEKSRYNYETSLEEKTKSLWFSDSDNEEEPDDIEVAEVPERRNRRLFKDRTFPASYRVIRTGEEEHRRLRWLRPRRIRESAVFVDKGFGRNDIMQGELGDCWVLAAISTAATNPQIIRNVLPEKQKVNGDGYTGKHVFKFWVFGRWQKVSIDDRLPCYLYGDDTQLAFARTKDDREFWVALLEKAYAKLNGGYGCIDGGISADALVDFSAGVLEHFHCIDYRSDWPKAKRLYRRMAVAYKKKAVLSCGKQGDDSYGSDKTGLVGGHAYSLTAVAVVEQDDGKRKQLVRVRNPWGDATEWSGNWNDDSAKWNSVSDQEKKRIDFRPSADGEFWMLFKDFLQHFDDITVCYQTPDFNKDGSPNEVGEYRQIYGEWAQGTDGGCRNDIQLYATNPQYVISIEEADMFDELTMEPDEDGFCDLHVTLMQDYRSFGGRHRRQLLYIGYNIYLLDKDWTGARVNADFFYHNEEMASSGTYINTRMRQGVHKLQPNSNYLLVPSTFYPGARATFLLRFYAEHAIQVKQL